MRVSEGEIRPKAGLLEGVCSAEITVTEDSGSEKKIEVKFIVKAKDSGQNNREDGDNPQTGDSTALLFWLLMSAVSICGIIIAGRWVRKRV